MVTRSELRPYAIALIANSGAMTIGMVLGWSSPTQMNLPVEDIFRVTEKDAETYGPTLCACAIFGALFAGILTNRIGYCRSTAVYYAIVVFGWILLLVANSPNSLDEARCMQGIGVGALSTVIPSYVGEISQPHIRGKSIAMFPVFIVVGVLWSYIVGSMTKYIVFNVASGMWTIVHLVGVFFLPESPYYLLKKGKDNDAYQSMMKLRDGNSANVVEELSTIKSEIERQGARSILDCGNLKSLFICCGCMCFQQINGINVLIFFVHYIFEHHLDEAHGYKPAVIVGVTQLIVTVLVAIVMDKVNRRKLLIISSILTSICTSIHAISRDISSILRMQMEDSVFIILIAFQISVFALGLGVVPWIIMGEIFSTKLKPYGTSFAAVIYWLTGLYTLSAYIQRDYIPYVLISWFGVLFFLLFIPDTKNKSLGEIQSGLIGTTSITETSNNAEA